MSFFHRSTTNREKGKQTMENGNRFQRFEKTLPGGFFVYEAKGEERLLYANQKCIELFQCTDFEDFLKWTGGSFRGLVHPVDYQRVLKSIWQQIGENRDNNDHVLYRITTKKGDIRWVDDFGRLIDDEEFGSVFVVSLYDITDRMHVSGIPCSVDVPLNKYLSKTVGKQKIEDSDVQALLDEVREALGTDLIYVFEGLPSNDGFEVTFESKKEHAESILGISRVVGPENFKQSYHKYREGGLVAYQTKITRRTGKILSYGVFHNDIYDGSVGIIDFSGKEDWSEDEKVSMQKIGRALHQAILFSRFEKIEREREIQQEKLEIALKAKTMFLGNMSHDIRTPMNAIMGFTRMAMEHNGESEKVQDYLKKIQSASEHMLQIINDVLDMVIIESGKMELSVCPMNLEEESRTVEDMFSESMEQKNISFEMHTNIVEKLIVGDPVRIRQILINLIGNSLKYTHSGGKVLAEIIQTGIGDEGVADYRIRVKDTGIGMSKEFQKHVFELFERERSATVSRQQGTGLGLAICKELVDLMGGTISCESEAGVGTEFCVTFTAKVAENFEKEEKQELDIEEFKGSRILLVEDNELNREIAKELMETRGLVVEEAENGAVAVEKVKKAREDYYAMILMDIQMPYMNGYEATKEIRKLENEKLRNIPIVAMTADAFYEDKERAIKAGMNGHLSKPIDFNAFFEVLNTTLKGTV